MALRKVCVQWGCDELALPGLSHCEDHEADRQFILTARRAEAKKSESQAWAHFYSGAWKKERRRYLQRYPLCADCAKLGLVVEAKEVDHIEPHRGDVGKFWDRANWQGLCKSCHSRKTAREVFHGRKAGGVV